MSLAFRCTRCGKAYSVAGQLAGRKVRCLACGLVQRIPVPAILRRVPIADRTRTPTRWRRSCHRPFQSR